MVKKFGNSISITTALILIFVVFIVFSAWKNNFSDDLAVLEHQNDQLLELLRSIDDTLVNLAELTSNTQDMVSNLDANVRMENQSEVPITELSHFVEDPSILPDLMNLPLDTRLKEEFSLLVDEYYVNFLRDINVDQITIDNIVLELVEEYGQYQDGYSESEDTETSFEFVSAQPGEGVAYIPSRVMSRFLEDEEFLQFSSFQSGLAKGQYDVFEYFEFQIRNLVSEQ